MNQSFLEKLNDTNYGKRGLYIAVGTVLLIAIVKLFITPIVQPFYAQQGWVLFKNVVNIVETIAFINMLVFFGAIFFYKQKIGHKMIYAMQLKDTTYFKEKWILWWMRSIWIAVIVLGITTVIKQALFKSWGSFIWLVLLLSIPFYLMPKMRNFQQRKF